MSIQRKKFRFYLWAVILIFSFQASAFAGLFEAKSVVGQWVEDDKPAMEFFSDNTFQMMIILISRSNYNYGLIQGS